MASTAFQWVRDGQADLSALSSPAGTPFLGHATVSAERRLEPASKDDGPIPQMVLAKIRADVAAKGGRWTDAKALAFGGVRAKVATPGAEPASAVTGNVYFVAGERVFALEVSAERVGETYIPTGIWQCVTLNMAPADVAGLEKHAQECYQAFMRESSDPASQGKDEPILEPAALFVTLQ